MLALPTSMDRWVAHAPSHPGGLLRCMAMGHLPRRSWTLRCSPCTPSSRPLPDTVSCCWAQSKGNGNHPQVCYVHVWTLGTLLYTQDRESTQASMSIPPHMITSCVRPRHACILHVSCSSQSNGLHPFSLFFCRSSQLAVQNIVLRQPRTGSNQPLQPQSNAQDQRQRGLASTSQQQ